MGAQEGLLRILAGRWVPRRLSRAMVCLYARWHAVRMARADRRMRPCTDGVDAGGPVYLADGFHGGLPFWDWIFLPSGGLWQELLWPAVGEVLLRRALDRGIPAILEIDGYTFSVMADQQPDAVARLKKCVASGTIEIVNGTYSQPFLSTLSGESIIRQFTRGLDAIEEALGTRVGVYASQEPCFCAQLPQILAGLGFTRALARTHWAPFGQESAHDAPLVRWRGPDGSIIVAVPRHTWMDYGFRRNLHPGALRGNLTGAHSSQWTLEMFGRFRAVAAETGSEPPLVSSLEDMSPFEAPTANALALDALPGVRLTTVSGYCDAVLGGRRTEVLPLWQPSPDDFPLDLPWGMDGDRLMQARDRAEAWLLVAERANAVELVTLGAEGAASQPSREGELARAWAKLLLAQHHDLHVCGPWLSRAHGKPMSSVGVDLCKEAEDMARRVVQEALTRLLERVDTADFEGQPVLVFNPASGGCQAPVPVEPGRVTATGGRALPSQIVDEAAVTVVDLPPLGWRVVDIPAGVPGRLVEAGHDLQFRNSFYEAVLSAGGSLTLSCKDQAVMCDGATLSLWRDGRWYATGPAVPGSTRRRLEMDGPVHRRWVVEGNLAGIPFTQIFDLYHVLPRIEVAVSLDFSGVPFGPQPGDGDGYYARDGRKLCACFPVSGKNDHEPLRVIHGAPFQISETGRSRFIGGRWAAVERAKTGLAVLATGARGYTFDRRTGVLRRVLAWSPESWLYASDDSVAGGGSRFSTLNGWHTFYYALVPYRDRSEVVYQSEQYCLPPVAVTGERSIGELRPSRSLLEIEGETAVLSAVFIDRGRLYVRLWNPSESDREVALRARDGWELAAAGLRLEEGERLTGGRLWMRAWGVQTVRLLSTGESPAGASAMAGLR